MYQIIVTDVLSEDAKFIRKKVFMEEQQFENEFDEIDSVAKHLVIYKDSAAIGCCRYFKDKHPNEYIIGRVAVLKEFRGKHFGEIILKEVETILRKENASKLSLSAQVRVQSFYEKQGFIPEGDIYFDEYCEHIHMIKPLKF